MRIVTGSGRTREVIADLPCLAVRAQDPKAHDTLIENLQRRICPSEMARYDLRRKGFRVYDR
jgi:hypothetical protein